MLIGVLGGGQLGRMLALAGLPLGLRFRFLDPAMDSPARDCGELIVGPFDDPATLDRFTQGLDAATLEFENVPVSTLEAVSRRVPVAPGPTALATGQDRLSEKLTFQKLGIPVPKYAPAGTLGELHAAVEHVGRPCVVKTRRLGYDGKGQAVLRADASHADAQHVWADLTGGRSDTDPATPGLIVEEFVPFDREVSMLAVRGRDGSTAFYPLVQNVHGGGILRTSVAPAPNAATLDALAKGHAAALLDELGYVGVLAVEFFAVGDRLLANELAPRVHNSGHWTIEGSVCSQFENHVRAVAGLPLGDTAMAAPAVGMANIIGRTPGLAALLAAPGVRPHLYGKHPRHGRKLGHATLLTQSHADLAPRLAALLTLIESA